MVADEILNRFYNKLFDQFLLENKIKNDSLLLSLLDVKSNDRFRAIRSSSITHDRIQSTILDELLSNDFIRKADEFQKYIITVKGIWKIEKELKGYSEQTLLEFLDEKYFSFKASKQNLSDKERVILFSMLCARTFSENSPIDLKKDDFVLDAWERIIDDCKDKLYKLKIIKKMNKEQLYGKKGNEHIVSHLVRHTDSLPKKVGGIFRAPGKQKYFLEIYNENELVIDTLNPLITIIFDSRENIPIEEITEILEFSKKIAYNEAPHVFESNEHIFASPEFDDIIEKEIKKALLLN